MVEGVSGLLSVAQAQRRAAEVGAEPGAADVAERERGAAVFGRQCRRAARAGA